jgi:hypothetical protein
MKRNILSQHSNFLVKILTKVENVFLKKISPDLNYNV